MHFIASCVAPLPCHSCYSPNRPPSAPPPSHSHSSSRLAHPSHASRTRLPHTPPAHASHARVPRTHLQIPVRDCSRRPGYALNKPPDDTAAMCVRQSDGDTRSPTCYGGQCGEFHPGYSSLKIERLGQGVHHCKCKKEHPPIIQVCTVAAWQREKRERRREERERENDGGERMRENEREVCVFECVMICCNPVSVLNYA